MKNVLVTGAAGFVGRNLVTALNRIDGLQIQTHTSADGADTLPAKVIAADLIFHLAGSNRPVDDGDFKTINTDLTQTIADILVENNGGASVVLSSTAQALLENPCGRSKKAAEDCLTQLATENGNSVFIYRLPGVFGKWSRPNYNTVVATFCHNVARDLPITISNPQHQLQLVYIDDVIRYFLRHLDPAFQSDAFVDVEDVHEIQLGELASRIQQFREMRKTLVVPDLSVALTKYLYTTYLSFLPEQDFAYPVELRTDDRGWLFELAKSDSFGQIFVSTTKPNITRGNHLHDTKVEKFCLIQGEGIIRLRSVESHTVLEYPVSDQKIEIVDIPPGYTHSITNSGDSSMVVLFWANEIFDPQSPDTYWEDVLR